MTVADLLRGLPSLAGPLPAFDSAPADPDELFASWLKDAIEAGVVEPHALTLSTVDPDGRPSARVLILKDLADGVWHFASSAVSRKGKELADNPWAALTFYWPVLGRQVRVRGAVSVAGAPDTVAPSWTLYHVTADEVEFWQGDPGRKHVRVQYTRSGSGWTRELLWP